MASLVANYSSDDTDSSEDESSHDNPAEDTKTNTIRVKEEIKEEEPHTEPRFGASYEVSDAKNSTTCIKIKVKEEVKEEIKVKEEVKKEFNVKEEVKREIKVKEEVKGEESKPAQARFTLPNFFGTSDEVSDDEDGDAKKSTTCIKVKKAKTDSASSRLPSLAEVSPGIIGSSVFINQFDRAEQAKNKILEKHVKLTEAAPKKPANQPVCWKFKKGKCHMGKNCRFFHAMDTLSSVEDGVGSDISNFDNSTSHRSPYHPAAYMDARRRPMEADVEDDDSYMSGMKKKKRVGINDRLVPPKKAFDALLEMRKKERPWTLPGAPS